MDEARPCLLDRLLGARARGLTPGQYKESLARDLEDLLNSRTALSPDLLRPYPECSRSVMNFGVADFAGMAVSSSADQARICATVRLAVERHEPRLRHVQVSLRSRPGSVNRIDISITGVLALPGMREAVCFNASLQPSSLHYSIQRGATA